MSRTPPMLFLVLAVAGYVLSPIAVNGKAGVVPSPDVLAHLVTGNGSVDVTSVWPGAADATMAFIVKVDEEGNAIGDLRADFTVPSATVSMELTCLSVKGNEAWIGGTVTRSEPAGSLLGNAYIVRVVDNGLGKSSAPDRMSLFRAAGPLGPAQCMTQPNPANGEFDLLFPWVSGNIQIR